MKFFLHTSSKVRIVNSAGLEWQGTPAAFLALEPGYPGLPSGAVLRYQTEELQYTETAAGERSEDTVDCLQYCSGSYLTTPEGALCGRLQSLLDDLDSRLDVLEAASGGAGVPIGCEMVWPFATAPSGWMLAHGGTVLRSSTYGTLLVNAGCPYGTGNGSTTVTVPDRRGQFLLGASPTYPLYSTGGTATVSLTANQNGPHSHPVKLFSGGTATPALYHSGGYLAYDTLLSTDSSGAGEPHNNMPPYQAVNRIIYVGA